LILNIFFCFLITLLIILSYYSQNQTKNYHKKEIKIVTSNIK